MASGHRLLSGCRDDVADRETSHSKLSGGHPVCTCVHVCVCLCIYVSMLRGPRAFQPEQKHWGLRCCAIPSACASAAEEIQELSQDVAAAQPKNGLCVCRGFCPAPEHPCRCRAAVAEIIKMRGRQSETWGSFISGDEVNIALVCNTGWRAVILGIRMVGCGCIATKWDNDRWIN